MRSAKVIFKVFGLIFGLFGGLAILGSVFLWGAGFYFDFPPEVDLGLPTADLFINGPASIITGIGLWQMKKWGYVMGWFCAGFYLYASVEIFVWAFQEGNLTPAILIPQTLAVTIAIGLMIISWKRQDYFG